MASIRSSVPGAGYGNPYVDSLIWGEKAWNAASGPIKVWFGQSRDFSSASTVHGPSDILMSTASARNWNETEKAAFDYAIRVYESVCGLTFARATSVAEANIVWWKTDLTGGTLGIHELPHEGQSWGYFNSTAWTSGGFQFGSDALNTVLHELGHGMGLAHPHDGGTGPDATAFQGVTDAFSTGQHGLNQGIWTVMSYNPGWDRAGYDRTYGNQAGLGAFDIAALQALYGKNTETGQGNDVYTLPASNSGAGNRGWLCLWDSDGQDTITAAQAQAGVAIDLRAATLRGGDPNAGGFVSREDKFAGGYTIANGVTIENAIGGRFADTLQGNAAANLLKGNDGADTLFGGSGNDTLHGGAGDDKLYGGAGRDSFVFESKVGKGANVDRIYDFNPTYDSILLDNKIFTKLGAGSPSSPKMFDADMFVRAAKAQDREDRIIYDRKNGVLFYDSDGTGAAAQVKVATLGKNLKLGHQDFFVI
ncbi:M10 family metallopeptidase C-terminal domain-containing protein [Microvirga lotononidis]|uniref:Putative calcium-binding protein n=1 Tax=Microvirga lotononidis TaxID=864069 RepID=I4YQ49_9HYPH|nr:M10 family metallopeptidase C-terminal domain-containing protein [Microvirga lotononidis]EIM26091.1 putative calcium-binding protein [Microvirga lotononidis]WQO25997.1 M10 family metallopeptidase C-terminal domain-containing protein [Microvirga lotononidis]